MKNILSALLATILLITLLAACSGSDTNVTSEPTVTTTEADASPVATEPAEELSEPSISPVSSDHTEDEPAAAPEMPAAEKSASPTADGGDISI